MDTDDLAGVLCWSVCSWCAAASCRNSPWSGESSRKTYHTGCTPYLAQPRRDISHNGTPSLTPLLLLLRANPNNA
ncbi:hypothetical protein CERSUDRAFT_87395 [Gelatoporia subvermispora B]|uniref:Uncharacterized protein n=1 Tax=Ceriporiopsis subvermispora (strain B) TaxID=914234 RepID=M2QLM7_CERS8|nr:hypothetical protein CERSUDRAFT_87395 [Gelatoporia subvermispora B]